MKKFFVVLALLVAGLPLANAQAAPPDNDNSSNATVIDSFPFTASLNTNDATLEATENQGNCGPQTHTVWYTFTALTNGAVLIDTFGSGFDTVLSVYYGRPDILPSIPFVTGSNEVDCNDESFVGPAGTSSLRLEFYEGDTYYIQLGGWLAGSGDAVLNVTNGASIAGRVTNALGEPLEDICVGTYGQGAGYGYAQTDANGVYVSPALYSDDYVVEFYDCSGPGEDYEGEFYDNKQDWENADRVSVSVEQAVTGIDAVLALNNGGDPLSVDLAITDVAIENVPLHTDGGPLPVGYSRNVTVNYKNLGTNSAQFVAVIVNVCPTTAGDCQLIGETFFQNLEAGATGTRTFRWSGLGQIGDQVVVAEICGGEESNYFNNFQAADHYSVIGGSGVGVNAVPEISPTFCF